MTKQIFYLMTVLIGLMFGRTVSANEPMKMTLTLKPDEEVVLIMAGSGMVTIDWGDGATSTHTLLDYDKDVWQNDRRKYNNIHTYSKKDKSVCTITISGGNITHLDCAGLGLTNLDVNNNTTLLYLDCCNNRLTNLDVSKNSKLTNLWCFNNQLTNLDVSKNPMLINLRCSSNLLTSLDVSENLALTEIYCQLNQLSTEALDALFESLPIDSTLRRICMLLNRGTKTCNQSIATSKGWAVVDSKELKFTMGGSMPLFEGRLDEDSFIKYLAKNIVYPEFALKNGIQGVVLVKFTVTPQGKVVNAEVKQSVHPLLDAEALRVINSSPQWTPAIQGGKNVYVNFTFPINFKLNNLPNQ